MDVIPQVCGMDVILIYLSYLVCGMDVIRQVCGMDVIPQACGMVKLLYLKSKV